MDICGEARNPARKHLLELAKKADVAEKAATEVIERIVTVGKDFKGFARDFPIRKETVDSIGRLVEDSRARLV